MICAHCGGDVGNGGVDKCLIVNDLTPNHDFPDQWDVLVYRFCRDNGCAELVQSLKRENPNG